LVVRTQEVKSGSG